MIPVEDLEAIVDHCVVARRLAEAGGDEFLTQLLDMVLCEAAGRLVAEKHEGYGGPVAPPPMPPGRSDPVDR